MGSQRPPIYEKVYQKWLKTKSSGKIKPYHVRLSNEETQAYKEYISSTRNLAVIHMDPKSSIGFDLTNKVS